jgi:hypothetical protein
MTASTRPQSVRAAPVCPGGSSLSGRLQSVRAVPVRPHGRIGCGAGECQLGGESNSNAGADASAVAW